MMWELSDKSDRVRQKNLLCTVKLQSSCRCIQCRKSMASSKIPAFVNAFSILLFPADVYPTSAATFIPD